MWCADSVIGDVACVWLLVAGDVKFVRRTKSLFVDS